MSNKISITRKLATISTARQNLINPIFEATTPVIFNKDGWLNATALTEHYGKRLDNWLANNETIDYMAALTASLAVGLNTWNPRELESTLQPPLTITKRGRHGGGTWLHPRLVILFARWLSPELAVWIDELLISILSGEWQRDRHITIEYHKEMAEELELTRELEGKETKTYHFSNEVKMINRVLTQGQTDGVDRQSLTAEGLKALGRLERKNTAMIARGWSYQDRKRKLQEEFVKKFPQLAVAEATTRKLALTPFNALSQREVA